MPVRAVFPLLCSLLLLALGCSMARAAVPTVDHIYIDRGQSVQPNGPVLYNQWIWADCTVDGGVSSVVQACFLYPDGKTVTIDPANNPTAFEVVDGKVRVEMYDASTPGPPPAGSYTVTIETDQVGSKVCLTTPVVPAVATSAPTLVSPDPNLGTTFERTPTLSWADGLLGSDLWLWVLDGATYAPLWYYEVPGRGGGDGFAVYNQDGTAALSSLTVGASYSWQLGNRRVETDTPTFTLATLHISFGEFIVTTPAPIQITRFGVTSAKTQDEFGGVSYHPFVSFEYEEALGWDMFSVACITDPSGVQRTLAAPDNITRWNSPTNGYGWWSGPEQSTPPSGAWSVTVCGADQTSDTVNVVLPPGPDEPGPTLISPLDGEVIHDFAPLLSWTDSAPDGAFDAAFVSEEGSAQDIWGSCSMAGGVNSAVYAPNGYLDFAPLEPNRSYFWRACSIWDATPAGSDPRASVSYLATRRGRFTEYGDWSITPSALPGKLLYSTYTAGSRSQDSYVPGAQSRWMLAGYSSDPNARTWFSPSGWYGGSWSPDGAKIAFLFSNDWTVGVAKADGTGAARLPSAEKSQIPPRWTPDGNHLVLIQREGGCPGELREVSLTETGYRTITGGPNGHICDAAVSPDGQWIAYQTDASTDSGLRLVRPDGTDDHALLVTECSDPSYSSPAVGSAAWSPDGRKLAVSCWAWDGDSAVKGIGVIDAAGGVLTTLFMVPEFYGCCGWPMHVTWSPDGSKLVFATDNHLGSQPTATPDGLPDMDLYLVNADGTGGLTRLTEDYSGDLYPSWWAPNTTPETPGGSATVTVGGTTVAFDNVTMDGSTTVSVSDAPPAPAPGQFTFLGTYYDVTTTASFSGPVTISLHYEDADVPAGTPESSLRLLHWDGAVWVDITTSVDTVNNVVAGQCTGLSPFAIAAESATIAGPLQPINADGSSIFKQRSAVPVKFKLLDAAGAPIADQVATLFVTKVSSYVSSGSLETVVDAAADSGYTFRYDAAAGLYIYNLKGLSEGTWVLRIEVCGISKECQIRILR